MTETATTERTDMMPVYRAFSRLLAWNAPAGEWSGKRDDMLARIVDMLPHGSGIDSKLDIDDSKPQRIIVRFSFHHMDENGYYDGWTDHSAIITPCLVNGYSLKITGRDRNQIKDYLHETFDYAISRMIDYRAL